MAHRHSHSCSEDPDFAALLRNAGLKATQPRLAIMKLLFHEHGPFTPDEIFQKIGVKDLDLTTVYRTTAVLEDAGILTRCEFGDKSARFEYRGNVEAATHHHHVICRKCRRVASINVCLGENWKKAVSRLGYADPGHSLEFFGICKACQ